jgi:hypothetical protein
LQKARDEMLDTMTTAEIASSGTYKAVNELLTNTSDAYETAVEEMDAYVETAGNALTDALGDGSDIKTMQEFLAYRDEFLKIGTSDAYGLTEEQTEALLEQSEALSDVGLQYKLLTSIMEKYGETLSDEDIAGLSGSLSDLSTEQL